MNYEVVKGSIYNRSSKDRPREGTILPQAKIEIRPTDEEFYLSMFGFDNSVHEHMSLTNTVAGFAGNYFCNFLYFDVDSPQPEQSLATARELVTNLYEKLHVSPKYLYIAFSGNKGYHIGLHSRMFGGFEPSKEIPKRIQVLAGKVVAECYGMTLRQVDEEYNRNNPKNFRNMDLSIYTPNRIFRVINSRNAKSGLYKTGLTSTELLTLSVEEIKALAKSPRLDYKPETKVSDLPQSTVLTGLWKDVLRFDPHAYGKGKAPKEKLSGDFFSPPAEGSRNNVLFKQAAMLFDKSELTKEAVRQLVSCINLASPDPLQQKEVDVIVNHAFNKTENNVKKPKGDSSLETFNNWWDEWVDYHTSDGKKLTCIYPAYDEDNEGYYLGKLCCLIGKGGSRKSFFAQNMISHNIMKHDARVIYSSMEMGKVEVVSRLLDIFCDPQEGQPASQWLKTRIRGDKESLRNTMKDTMAHIDQHLILSNVAMMDCSAYENLIKKTIELYGSLDMLVIDGLSAMGGKGTETEVYSRNTLELKELAKRYNIFVVLICHVTKEAKEYSRDPRNNVRGSEKILDNADFFISFSQLIDRNNSTPDNLSYVRHNGHIKYYNKRGTGKTSNDVYLFDSITKRFLPTSAIPEEFPTYEQFVSEYTFKTKKNGKAEAQPF